MMKKQWFVPVFMLAFSSAILAAPLPGSEEVRALGDINGVALACRQEAILERIRTELDVVLSAKRDIGYDEIFKAAIEESFLRHQNSRAPCPEAESATPKIDTLFKRLRATLVP
ncbi:MAG: hypothetical protein LBO00_07465 [Zoogloeaceae bacterium]|jgi:hypothetical protein|nr:hypothetical protein [Zoogloeaceae bacterium]